MEQADELISPRECLERRQDATDALVEMVVRSWRPLIAKAMASGNTSVVTTSTTATPRHVLDAARDKLDAELKAKGWKQLDWAEQSYHTLLGGQYTGRYAQLGNQHYDRVVELRWFYPDTDAPR